MNGRSLFSKQQVGAIAIVEPPVSAWYARRAEAAALVVGLFVAVLTSAVLSVFGPVLLAVALGVFAGGVAAVLAAVLVRVWPVLRVLWWWSIEIAAATLLVGGWVALAHVTAWRAATAVILLPSVLVLTSPQARRLVSAWSWCVVVRHRLRVCFATLIRSQARAGARPAVLPLVLWARPTPAGERVWLWLRPGLSVEDLDGKAPWIAVTCVAKQVRISSASERYAALLRVDVSRRDPLAGRIDSPLALLVPRPKKKQAYVPVSPAVPPVGLDLADIEEPSDPQPRGGRR